MNMKRILFSTILLALACTGQAQKGFGLDGSLGFGLNGGELVNPLLLEGRIQWDDHFSSNLGLGLWNSGYKQVWKAGNETSFTIFHLSDSKPLPSVQLSSKAQVEVFRLLGRSVRFYAEPKLIFLPFSARTSMLEEDYYISDVVASAAAGETVYKLSSSAQNTYKSECHPRFYYGLQGGLSTEVYENFDLSIGFGYTNMDLFKDLRGQSLHGVSLDNYLPRSGITLISISLLYHYNFD
jgi:hypothetical protein